MLKNLPHGVKISISRSITTAFEQYMKAIEWNEDKYNLEVFMKEWQNYAGKNSSWLEQIDDSVKNDSTFHQELADKINQSIKKVLTEEPKEEQIQEIERLTKKLNIVEMEYSCRAEANYVIDMLTKKVNNNK
ncbi:hypothetical protein [Fredinandcohnia quinoae]|uniref:Group-specific protein n=1 Tax=Fredinandcohnia quinoae TaxID=2918902 RepID=A0AAW5E5Z7_9BACI|nr:hypothetical protein [Fredinandcohnia sp. SECRCQ15]MCH1627778.1 hypothetical protein [Fredinandcohnia sp. SECRCQ15]